MESTVTVRFTVTGFKSNIKKKFVCLMLQLWKNWCVNTGN
jgi:hypothetical protein